MADERVMMPGRNGGSLRVGGPGRPASRAAIAMREARYELDKCLKRLVEIRDDPKSSTDDVVKACLGIMRLSGIDKEKPRPYRRTHFGVLRASEAEAAEALTRAVEDAVDPKLPREVTARAAAAPNGTAR
jgi:hypothetical protein